jgi:AbrB family looped-hinge helix DNA binding protein
MSRLIPRKWENLPMTLVKVRRSAQITLPRDIRDAARLEEGDYLDAEVTDSGAIVLRPVSITGREPTPEQEAEILAAVDEARSFYAKRRRR